MYTLTKKNTVFAIGLFLCTHLTPLKLPGQGESYTFSLKPYFKILDTIDRHGGDPYMNVLWMDTIIALRIPLSEVYAKKTMNKFRELYEKKGEVFDTAKHKARFTGGVQNCHSYALERYLFSKQVQDNSLFTASHGLFNGEMAKILAVSFKRNQRLTPKEFKKYQHSLTPQTLLVFKDKHETPIHSVFYDQGFHSKNGALSPHTFEEINPLLKSYFDTVWIDLYEINSSQFANHKN